MTAYEDLELRAPNTDDEPWPVYADRQATRSVWAHFKAQPGFIEEERAALRGIPDPPADRRGWALVLTVLIVAVVAIVWWR